MSVYYSDDRVTLHLGDALDVAHTLPDGAADCIVTSPPYYGLRDYGVKGQYGLESSPAEYVERMRALFAELRRVLSDDGTLWLNLGDSYASTATNNGGYSAKSGLRGGKLYPNEKHRAANDDNKPRALRPGVAPKNLLGIPWRVAFALQAEGWILRNDVIWHKTNAMPESVRDRLSNRHEHVFMFSKSRKYWFGLDDIREPCASTPDRNGKNALRGQKSLRAAGPNSGQYGTYKNPGDVWSISTRPFPEAHFAVQSPDLAERCVLAGCKHGGIVLDPFSGSGTTGMVALQHGRNYIGIDINRDYHDLALNTRLQDAALGFGGH